MVGPGPADSLGAAPQEGDIRVVVAGDRLMESIEGASEADRMRVGARATKACSTSPRVGP
jgi:hypothetical protein